MLLASGYIRNLDLIPPGSFGRDNVCETLAPSRVYAFENYLPAFGIFHPQQSTINPVMLIFHDFHDDDEKG